MNSLAVFMLALTERTMLQFIFAVFEVSPPTK